MSPPATPSNPLRTYRTTFNFTKGITILETEKYLAATGKTVSVVYKCTGCGACFGTFVNAVDHTYTGHNALFVS